MSYYCKHQNSNCSQLWTTLRVGSLHLPFLIFYLAVSSFARWQNAFSSSNFKLTACLHLQVLISIFFWVGPDCGLHQEFNRDMRTIIFMEPSSIHYSSAPVIFSLSSFPSLNASYVSYLLGSDPFRFLSLLQFLSVAFRICFVLVVPVLVSAACVSAGGIGRPPVGTSKYSSMISMEDLGFDNPTHAYNWLPTLPFN